MTNQSIKTWLIIAIVATTIGEIPAAYAQGNRIARLRRDQGDIWVAGTISKIQRTPPVCELTVDEVLVGDGKALPKKIDLRRIVNTNTSPPTLNPFSPSIDYPIGPERIQEGARWIVCINRESSIPNWHLPIRVIDRFHAVSEFSAIRETLNSKTLSRQTIADTKSKLLDELHKVAKTPFWEEYREGAEIHPRVEEICEALTDLESKSGEKVIDKMIADSKEDVHLRAALFSFQRQKSRDAELPPLVNDLIIELQSQTKTEQDASALLAVANGAYKANLDDTPLLLHAGELIREGLSASHSSEYRIAFVKRVMWGWREPHQTRRFDAIMAFLETEPCDPDPKTTYPPPDTVGDWLIHHMLMAQTTNSIKTKGVDGYDLTRLHPTARKRLEQALSAPDPNKQHGLPKSPKR